MAPIPQKRCSDYTAVLRQKQLRMTTYTVGLQCVCLCFYFLVEWIIAAAWICVSVSL